ncbi:hypothetical protein CO670_15385 [Rhizobium sp. J15]|uniref:hypothetical protein n=1 Tax=Rhizobium sp. J15 TaxID=2035450 RepID=UPI000BE9A2DA|nr:hypothetical protein [Rhizobium sp. J15]PDT15878.1 hypothetical protein CO670_15385 [Rhizobium sp. J15]
MTTHDQQEDLYEAKKEYGLTRIVGWTYEDELPENYPYDAMFKFSVVDAVRMFPVFAPEEPATMSTEALADHIKSLQAELKSRQEVKSW